MSAAAVPKRCSFAENGPGGRDLQIPAAFLFAERKRTAMRNAPLYDAAAALSSANLVRFDMPGHHGKALPCFSAADWTALDCTEHQSTGNLFSGDDIIEEAERLWARKWNFENCLFLTGGSTEGVHIALHLCCRPGDRILVDRGSHRSLWNGLALLDADPISVPRPWDRERELPGPLNPETVEAVWARYPDARALFVTSPTYYGIESDLSALAETAHRHGGTLIVDAAHGAHYPWIGRRTPGELGADIAVLSAHKTLPAPGQSALLMYSGFSSEQVRRVGRIYGSSSPSYIMMTAMDSVRNWLDHSGAYRDLTERLLPYVRNRLERETVFRIVPADDPARLVLSVKNTGLSGFEILKQLEQQNILIEMADLSHLVLIASCMDTESDFDRLIEALKRIRPASNPAAPELPAPPDLPTRVLPLRQAMFAEKTMREPADCAGRICAEDVTPYPPGIPVLAPGERIEKKHLDYLRKIGYNESIAIVDRDSRRNTNLKSEEF